MLAALQYKVVVPTAFQFLEFFHRANRCDGVHREAALYFVELALLDHRMVRHAPSLLASAAVLLSNQLLGRNPCWPAAMVRHSRYAEEALQPCVGELRALLVAAPGSSLQAVRKKYMHPSHQSVARMAPLNIAAPVAGSDGAGQRV